jgi:hypothetical protein
VSADLVNGLFESMAGLMVFMHCRRLWIDKQVRGVSFMATGFFASWGFWNLFYYPHLGQTWSFIGGLVVMTANLTWIGLMIRYRRN